MPMFFITGWSPHRGDVAYVEGEHVSDAIAVLAASLVAREITPRPPVEWTVRAIPAPFVHFEWSFDWARGT